LSKKQQLQISILVIGVAATVIFLDQLTKILAIENLTPGIQQPLLGEIIQLNLAYNDSAAFSLGNGATSVFAVISFVAALALLWFVKRVESKSWAAMLGIALGGVVGNLIDRLFREPGFGRGLVVDFIQIPFNFPIFNIADSAIVATAVLVVIRVMRGEQIGKAKNHD
jgi:signal peptidase II